MVAAVALDTIEDELLLLKSDSSWLSLLYPGDVGAWRLLLVEVVAVI